MSSKAFDLSVIVNKGYHVVPIGSSPNRYKEWRVSFSVAEQNLKYFMNYCQFQCYGLLKVFLKEVIKTTVKILKEVVHSIVAFEQLKSSGNNCTLNS